MRTHMRLDIRGFLMNEKYPRGYRCFTDDDGAEMEPRAARAMLFDELSKGHKYLAFGSCEGFDPMTGCPGHPDTQEPSHGD